MRQFILLFGVIFLILSGTGSLKAQPNSLYFLKGVPQTKDLNPARPGIKKGYYISMPLFSKLDLSINSNNISFNDLIHKGTGAQADSMVYDFKKFLSVLDENNFVNESVALTLIEFGWKKEDNFYGFSWTEREYSEPFFTKSLANLIYYGNAPYVGTTYSTGYSGIVAQHYREFAFTYSKELNKKMNVGITGKLLFGLAGLKTSGVNIVAGMPKSGDQIDLNATGKVYMSAPVEILLTNNNGNQLHYVNNYSLGSYLTNFGNPGLAVDLGIATKVTRNFEFSMSLVDLGFISWMKDITSFSENGNFLYRGINLDTQTPTNNPPVVTNISSLIYSVRDSLQDAFVPDQPNKKFMTILPVKFYAAGEYKLNEQISMGGVARVRMLNNFVHTSVTASANAAISRNFSISGSYSYMESTPVNIGLAAAYRIGHVQLYAASDNISSFFNPTTATNANLRIGINLIYKDEERSQKGIYKNKKKKTPVGCPFDQ
jgi:hypothetical protein